MRHLDRIAVGTRRVVLAMPVFLLASPAVALTTETLDADSRPTGDTATPGTLVGFLIVCGLIGVLLAFAARTDSFHVVIRRVVLSFVSLVGLLIFGLILFYGGNTT